MATIRRNLKPGTRIVRGAQDIRADQDSLPFYASGYSNTMTGMEAAIDAVVADAGGWQARSPGYTGLRGPRLHVVDAEWFGEGQVFGNLVYARGAADCSPKRASVTMGFIETRGTEGTHITDLSSSNVCSDFDITTFVKRRAAVEHIALACVWRGTRPAPPTATQVINDANYTIDGRTYAANTLRFDGYQYEAHEARGSTGFYKGQINWTYMAGGWKSHKITCVRWEYDILRGNQTIPGVVLQVDSIQIYLYPTATFTPISTMCPHCYGTNSSG